MEVRGPEQPGFNSNSTRVPIDQVIANAELESRPSRSPDYRLENEVLRALSRALGESPKAALQKLVEEALRICKAESAGISIAESGNGEEVFRWHAIAGTLSPFVNGTMPRYFSPCGEVLKRSSTLLMRDLIRHYEYVAGIGVGLSEVLFVPFYLEGKAVGTIWIVAHTPERKFDREDRRILESLAEFTSGVVQSYFKVQELEDAHRELQGFFMQAPVPMMIVEGPEHRFTLANPLFLRLVGRPVLGRTVEDAFSEEETARFLPIMDEVYRTGVSYVGRELPLCLTDENGVSQNLWIDVSYHPHRDEHGKTKGLLVLIQDVTEQVNTRKLVENERENFRRLFKQTPETVCITRGPEHVFEFVNAAHVKTLGFDATGKSLKDAQPESVEVHDVLDHVYATGETVELNEAPITITDRVRFFNFTFSARRDDNGQITGVMILGLEVTEQILARVNLKESQERLARALDDRRFLDQLNQILVQSNRLDQIVEPFLQRCVSRLGDWAVVDLVDDANVVRRVAVAHKDPSKAPLAQEMRSYPPSSNHLHSTWEVLASGKPLFECGVSEQLLAARKLSDRHLELMHAMGTGAYAVHPLLSRGKRLGALTLVYADSNKRFNDEDRALMQEVAQRAALAFDNATLYEETEKAVRLRDEFLSIASHELKTPLTGMKIQTQLFNRTVAKGITTVFEPTKIKQIIGNIDSGLNRMVRLIDDMLDSSRIQLGKLALHAETVDLSAVVTETMGRLTTELTNAGIALRLNVEPGLACELDRFRFEQVLTNLATNATRYAPNAPVDVTLSRRGDRAVLHFQDHGRGIPRESHESVFKRFERLTSASEVSGMGLGLFICREIIESHGGTIGLDPDCLDGARFVVELPLARVVS